MNPVFFPRAFSVVCVLFFSSAASAGIELRVLSWKGRIDNVTLVQGRAEFPLVAHEQTLSPRFEFPGEASVSLVRERLENGKTVRETLGVFAPPARTTKAILILSPDETGGGGYAGLMLDDSLDENPAGTIRFKNLSSHTVALKVSGEQLQLAPRADHLHAFDRAAMRVGIQTAVKEGEGWRLVTDATQPVRSYYRVFLLIRDGRPRPDSPQAEPIEVLSFSDYVPPSAPAVASQ